MTTIEAAVAAIKRTQSEMQAEIDLLRDRERSAEVIITMFMDLARDMKSNGTNTKQKRDRYKNVMQFGCAHTGVEYQP